MARGRRPAAGAQVVGWLLVAGLVLLALKWLLITAAILAVPFGVWWLVDRSRQHPPALGTAVPVPIPRPAPAPAPVPVPVLSPAPARADAPRPARTPAAPRLVPVRPVASRPGPPASPAPHVLPADRQVTVTREEDHQDVLARHHRSGAPPTPVAVELCSSAVTRGKYRGDYAVEVRVDGCRVGELTAAMSARYRHLVDLAGPVRCRGVITHGSRGFQIDLRLPDVA